MMSRWESILWVCVAVFCLGVLAGANRAQAQVTIFICGSASDPCEAPEGEPAPGGEPDGDRTTPLGGPGTNAPALNIWNHEDDKGVAIPLDPAADYLETPAGWSGPTTPPSSQTPETIATGWGRAACAGPYSSVLNAAACSSGGFSCSGGPTSACSYTCSGGSDQSTLTGCQNFNNVGSPLGSTYSITASTFSNTCDPGYTYGPGTCTLTDPGAVERPPNSVCAHGEETDDNDCTILGAGDDGAVDFTEDEGVIDAVAEDGTRARWTPDGDGDGGGTLDVWKPNGTGGTDHEAWRDGDGDGVIDGSNAGSEEGQGTLHDPETPQGDGGAECGAPGQPECAIDESGTPESDGGAIDAVGDALDGLEPGDFGVGEWDGSGPSSWGSGLPTIAGSSGCTNPFTYTIWGEEITFDLCSVWAPAKEVLAWFLYLFTAFYMWRRAAGAAGVQHG